MPEIPFQLRYTLSRSQRFVPLIRVHVIVGAFFATALFAFFMVSAVISIFMRSFEGVGIFGVLTLGVFWLEHGFIVGLVNVFFVPVTRMDVVIEKDAAGILIGKKRWYLFLD